MFWTFLIGFAVLYLTQTVLGLRQSKNFADTFTAMRRRGKVALGKKQGLLVAGALVLFLLDDAGHIVEGRKLSGVTVLSRFKTFDAYNGLQLADLFYACFAGAVQRDVQLGPQASCAVVVGDLGPCCAEGFNETHVVNGFDKQPVPQLEDGALSPTLNNVFHCHEVVFKHFQCKFKAAAEVAVHDALAHPCFAGD